MLVKANNEISKLIYVESLDFTILELLKISLA